MRDATSADAARAATQVEIEKFLTWDAAKDGSSRSYRAGGLMLTFKSANKRDEPTAAILIVQDAQGHRVSLSFDGGFDHPTADVAVGSLDRSNPTMQVILSSYSGGAHCCTERRIAVLVDGKWKVSDLPAGEEQDVNEFPKDENGSGVPAFVLSDDRFAYIFSAFAGSWMPPRVFVLRNGALVELSNSRRYDKVYLVDMALAKAACLDKSGFVNGGCAGFVADGARAGQFESAWRFMLAHYQRNDNWGLPDGCKVESSLDACPKGSEIEFDSYPQALAWFLKHTGYISNAQENWAVDPKLGSAP